MSTSNLLVSKEAKQAQWQNVRVMKIRKRKLYDSGEKMGGKKVTVFSSYIDLQEIPYFYVGPLKDCY